MLLGRFAGCEDGIAYFTDDLAESVAFGDARYGDVCGLIRKTCIERGMDVPDMPPPAPFTSSPRTSLDVRRFGAVIVTSGYRPDYASWIRAATGFDELGYPIQRDGSSTVVPGLHFMGVHFQRTRKSASLLGVAEDAAILAERIWVERTSSSSAV
jgi:putative flavoprotein involved in K+ transport